MNPFFLMYWKQIAAGVVAILFVLGAYLHGVSVGTNDTAAEYEAKLSERDRAAAVAMAEALGKAHAQAQAAMEAERKHLQTQAKTEARFRGLTKTVKEYIYEKPSLADCGLDDIGLRYWNAANGGGATGEASNP